MRIENSGIAYTYILIIGKATKHGFRPGRSCLSALLDVFDNIMHMLDSDSSVDMVYLDFSKGVW